VRVVLDNGETADAVAPLIISASRSTDIPAFYSEWFIHRLARGYVKWINPFNNRAMYVSLEQMKLIAFWSKNPQPLIRYFDDLNKRCIRFFIQFTLNDYEQERLEPAVSPLSERMATFRRISSQIGKERVLWRFDPLVLTESITAQNLLDKIQRVGDQISPYTTKLTISFLVPYAKVQRNMNRAGHILRNFDNESIARIGEGLKRMSLDWGIPVTTCAQQEELGHYGIEHGACIDSNYIARTFPDEPALQAFLNDGSEQLTLPVNFSQKVSSLKDRGQRDLCRCIVSKDIGRYDTCAHFCTYCYANIAQSKVVSNRRNVSLMNDGLVC
jgi:hypothetical protein